MRTARYRAVPPKSIIGGRLREKKKEEKEEKKKEEEEEQKKKVPPRPCAVLARAPSPPSPAGDLSPA
ncbi:hypothetical protein BHM03_00002179 [Ensete ventricosum]|nr:hypothetical protein BHM03_00002179 [Ensete ventricosum]